MGAVSIIAALGAAVLVTGAQYALGGWVITRFFGEPPEDPRIRVAAFVVGLSLHCWLIFGLRALGLGWLAATIIGAAILLPGLRRGRPWLRPLWPRPDAGFLLWWIAHLSIAASLLHTTDVVATPWVNAWSDYAYHLPMIAGFVEAPTLPPSNHLFAGATLSYPFLVNLWTASLWWPFGDTSYGALSAIFTVQWMVCWTAIYALLDGRRHRLAPWALLLGGGSLAYALSVLAGDGPPLAHQLINSGAPWTPFATTVWVPQRSAMVGVVFLLVVGALVEDALAEETPRASQLALAGLVTGLAPLAHAHMCLVALAYSTLRLVQAWLLSRRDRAWRLAALRYAMFASCGLLFSPVLLGKAGIVWLGVAWMQPQPTDLASLWHGAIGGARLWASNAAPWAALAVVLAVFVPSTRRALVVLAALFAAGNVVHIAIWDWDQIKIFIALYALTLLAATSRQGARGRVAAGRGSGAAEIGRVMFQYESHTIYDADRLALAREIRAATEPDDVIAAAPKHNSAVSLAGRTLYVGTPGVLWSHGIDAAERLERGPAALVACDDGDCPDYLLWTRQERAHWPGFDRPANLETTSVKGLYRVPRAADD